MSPTQRSLAWLRKAGYEVAVVERYNPFAHVRNDLFGFCDLLAFRAGMPLMFVQTTSATNSAARRRKILQNSTAKALVQAHHEVVIHAWGKRGARGEKKVWTPEPEWLEEDQFA